MRDYDLATESHGRAWERAAIERVMSRGLWADMRWLLESFDQAQLRQFLTGRGRRTLPPRELRFWGTICRVAPPELDRWVDAARRREGTWRG